MNKLLVFFNFIRASERALDQAIALGKKDGAKIILSHILKSDESESEALKKLEPIAEKVRLSGIEVAIELERGDIFVAAAKVAKKIEPDLVIAGTRGTEGFDLSIFGSAIYKFVRDVSYSSLVVYPDSKIAEKGYQKILTPVSPHKNFLKKVKESLKVLAKDGQLIIFALKKEGIEMDSDTNRNIRETKEFLDSEGVKYEYREFGIEKNEHNFAEQTLAKMSELGTDLISISADVSERNKHFGKMHKEDVLMNSYSMPVLCVNTDIE